MKRPRITTKVAKGLGRVASIVDAELSAGALDPDQGWPKGGREEAEAAIEYLRALQAWYEGRRKAR